MPPKKTTAKSKATRAQAPSSKRKKQESPPPHRETKVEEAAKPVESPPATASKEEPTTPSSPASKSNTSKKRRSPPSQEEKPTKRTKTPAKVPRQGTRTSTRTNKQPSSSDPNQDSTPKQVITYLLSPSSLPLAYPSDELSFSSTHMLSKTYSRTPPHKFTPFQHLFAASLLSKPLSHRLGLRSIRTLLNPPFSLTSPSSITSAGEGRVWEALEAARTQHRQKTAAYIFKMGEMCHDDEGKWGEEFEGLRTLEDGVEGIVKEIKARIKGMGGTGAELFLRRVQCCQGWEPVWPFADGKALEAVRDMGMVGVEDAAGLRDLVEEVVEEMGEKLGDMGLEGWENGLSKEQRLRIAFVVVLERAIGASLEGNAGEVRKAALKL